MIKISEPYIENNGEKVRLCTSIYENGQEKTLWYEVENEYSYYLTVERVDCFIVDLLYYAMITNQDIEYEGYMSERLHYQLSEYWIPVVTREISQYKKIKLIGKLCHDAIECKGAIATGVSGGVDSFYTIYRHLNINDEKYRLTHLTYLNLGGVGFKGIREDEDNRVVHLKKLSHQLNLPIVLVDTNESEWYKNIKHVQTHPLRTLSSILALQKLFSVYYFSSAFLAHKFSFDKDASYYDLFTIPLLSTENTQFFSHSPSVSRLDKLRILSQYEMTYDNLYVCFRGVSNCGMCEKCKRTILELYSLGYLSKYKNSFDIDKFEKNKKYYIIEALISRKDKKWYNEICQELEKNKKIKFSWKIVGFILKIMPKRFRNIYLSHFQKK